MAQTHVPYVAVLVLNIKGEIINFVLLEAMLNSGPPDVPSPFDDLEVSSQERTSERIGDPIVDVPLPFLPKLFRRFRERVLELIGRFEFDFRRRGNYFQKPYSNYLYVRVQSHAL